MTACYRAFKYRETMDTKFMNNTMNHYEQMRDALCVSVKIDHGQQLKVIINDLRTKRKHCADTKQWDKVKHFDFVLKYYLGEDDFKKYVIEWADIEL
jgi:hypothetical protein